MLSWKLWRGDAAEWDASLLQFPDYTIYQSSVWGEHKSHFGWIPHRLIASEHGRTVAMAQVLTRRFPLGVALAWVNGGPLGAADAWGEPFRRAIGQAAGARQLYCRVNPMRERSDEDVDRMKSAGWRRSTAPILTGRSLAYLPSESGTVRESRASPNWRHNLRRSSKYGHVVGVWPEPDPDEMLTIYGAMQSHKKLETQISRPVLLSMLEAFGRECVVVRCSNPQGRLLALRGALVFGNKAWDIFAAATPEARKVYASYAAFWELMRQCAEHGVQWYDMGGADPVGNKGVYDFKKGSGASDLLFTGEWDWATSSLLRHSANYMIRRRGGGM